MLATKKSTYVFNSKEVKRCIHHAASSTHWTKWSDEEFNNSPADKFEYAALIVMQDYSGVYIMSAGQPRDRLRNKKIYSAYAKGCDNNPKEHLRDGAVWLSDMSDEPYNRCDCLAVIYLSVGENGHVYEELLAEMHDEFVVEITPATDEVIRIQPQHLSRNAARKIEAIDMNDDQVVQNMSPTQRRLLSETTTTTNNR
jgi:hypothetical protein